MRALNMKTLSITLLSIILIVIFMVSCDKDGISEAEYQIQYRREAQLDNAYANGIMPLNTAFVENTTVLRTRTQAFVQQPNLENLDDLQNQWVSMLKVWKRLELYNLGIIEDSFIHFEINRWPTNAEIVNGYIEGAETIDVDFIVGNGSSSKGISAMEYLLFSSDDNQEILNQFTTNPHFERRQTYLLSLAQNLEMKANELQMLWIMHKTDFISSLENGISGSQNQLTNAMVTLIEEIIISKLGNPLGNGNGGTINIEELEAYRSESSLLIIQEHLTALKMLYNGDFTQGTINWGFNDYLDLIDRRTLNEAITSSFDNCQDKLNLISESLKQELLDTPQNAIDLQDAFDNLLVLIKVDMANAIGTTITINDNDGD